jgi:SAM-dependent methyltransferase
MTTQTLTTPASTDRQLKERHRAIWASGDYPLVARTVIPDLGAVLVQASGIHSGQQVLDVAAGSGNAAIPAAATGARVMASDLTPELFEAGREAAAQAGVDLEWCEADAEALPFDDGAFDAVLSCVGVMFAPHHQAAADELLRVCAPGGTIGLANWTPQGFIGRLLGTMRPYAPPPPPGVQPPPLWGDAAHVADLLGDRVRDVAAWREVVRVDAYATPADFREGFKASYGPVLSVYRSLGDDAARIAALDAEVDELARSADVGTDGSLVMEWEYLLLTATRT